MTRTTLVPCPACSRHIRVSEPACPFCGGAVSAALRATPAPVPPRVRLSRAALLAWSAGAATAAACAGDIEKPPADGGADVVVIAPADAGSDAEADSGYDAGHDAGFVVPYGLPPHVDAGQPQLPDAAVDAGHDAGFVVPYGLPPQGDGGHP